MRYNNYHNMIWKDGKEYKYNKEFINYLRDEIVNKKETINSISKKIGVSYRVIKNIVKENNIQIQIHNHNSSYKAVYQDYDWCYQKFIIEGLNHDEMAREGKTSKRTIEKWCVEKHHLTQKYRQKNKRLNNIQKDLIIGSLLGDGHIDKRDTQPLFIVSHAVNQKDYLFWKYDILKDFCNIKPTYYENKDKKIFPNGKEYKCQPHYRLCTRVHDCLIPLRKMSVKELLDNFNEFSFSVALLDDGYRGNIWSYCIAPYTKEEKEYMIKIFKTKFNINGYINEYNDRYMNFNAIDSKKIDNIILKSIPNNLDIVQDKIINNNKIKKLCNYRIVKMNDGTECGLARFCKNNHLNYEKYKTMCDIYDNGMVDENSLLLKCKED